MFFMASTTAIVLLLALFASTAVAMPVHTTEVTTRLMSSKSSTAGEVRDKGACRLSTTDPYVHNKIVQALTGQDRATMINYMLSFANYTDNPLTINLADAYDAKRWSRVTTALGQTLLSLAFNYGALSMMTLTLGTKAMHVELQDSPSGCFAAASDQFKIESVRQLLMRDFDADGPITTVDDGRVCNEIIVDQGGYAKFRHSCCFHSSVTDRIECTTDIGNFWLSLLYTMLVIVRYGLIFFGPTLFISAIKNMSKDNIPYIVRLREKLGKTVCFSYGGKDIPPDMETKRTLDLTNEKGFPKLRNAVLTNDVPLGKPVRVRFPQYDILVDYKRLLPENRVPAGLFQTLFNSLCKCHIRFVGPFVNCCKANMLYKSRHMISWKKFFKKFAKVLMVLLVPTPFYLRLVIFYEFEYDSLQDRKQATGIAGLKESFENSLIHYLTPTHGFFIIIYLIYAAVGFGLAFTSHTGKENRLKRIVVESFRDLESLDWTDTLSMVVSNIIWPFEKFGWFGCFVGLIYWPIALTATTVIATAYFLPTIYLTIRIAVHSKIANVLKLKKSRRKKYQVQIRSDQDMYQFESDRVISKITGKDVAVRESMISLDDLDHIKPAEYMLEMEQSSRSSSIIYTKLGWQRGLKCVVCVILCVAALFSTVLIMSEVIGCLVEIIVFTTMGCIVNASAVLPYVILILQIFIYCGEYFKRVYKEYLKMNKVLFSEIKYRIKDLDKVISLPSYLQENRGFKAQELSEQEDYELPDDVAGKHRNHWIINDLVLFVDSEDTPRIPKQLFNDVTQIRVAGVPGPVFRGQLQALRQLIKITVFICFVFIIILSFGSVYKVSSVNQTMAAFVGGFLPLMLNMLAPPAPSLEISVDTVTFKYNMDEVIANFCQYWPMYDLPFELVSEDENTGVDSSDTPKSSTAVTTNEYADNFDDIDNVDRGSAQLPSSTKSLPGCNVVDILVLLPTKDGQSLLEDFGEITV